MGVRRRSLPGGWYPATEAEIRELLDRWMSQYQHEEPRGQAGIVPHAGWMFSGKLAFEVMGQIQEETEVLVVVGGHLSAADGILAAFEEEWETPLGNLALDLALLKEIRKSLEIFPDNYADNTVEIQLPMVKYLFPHQRILALRAGPNAKSIRLGEALAEMGEKKNIKIAVIGSTDLTHYGPAYGYTPKGRGERALEWVKNSNDKQIVDAFLSMNMEKAINLAQRNKSACSSGGAGTAGAFAKKRGCQGSLVGYYTSYDIHPNDSFVGYAGVLYR